MRLPAANYVVVPCHCTTMRCYATLVVPLATSVEMREEALIAAKKDPPSRERGIMLRGDRIFNDSDWDLGAKSKGQFH